MRLTVAALALLLPSAAAATLTVSFRDGAPKDMFTLTYTGACALDGLAVDIDLGTAPARLIFDTSAAGVGVEVFQPLEWVAGTAAASSITDGDTALAVTLGDVEPGGQWRFTVDIDDTTSVRQITVDGSEMQGATLRASGQTALFDDTGTAMVALPDCTS